MQIDWLLVGCLFALVLVAAVLINWDRGVEIRGEATFLATLDPLDVDAIPGLREDFVAMGVAPGAVRIGDLDPATCCDLSHSRVFVLDRGVLDIHPTERIRAAIVWALCTSSIARFPRNSRSSLLLALIPMPVPFVFMFTDRPYRLWVLAGVYLLLIPLLVLFSRAEYQNRVNTTRKRVGDARQLAEGWIILWQRGVFDEVLRGNQPKSADIEGEFGTFLKALERAAKKLSLPFATDRGSLVEEVKSRAEAFRG